MIKDNQKVLIQVIKEIQNYKNSSKNRTWFKKQIRGVINNFPSFNKIQKQEIYNEVLRLAFYVDTVQPDKKSLERLVKIINRSERKNEFVKKQQNLKKMLHMDFSSTSGKGYPAIFFACSMHNKCADDHEEYQGKIYVDRFWKSKLVLHGTPEWLIQATEKFIRNNKTKTVQEVIGKPIYLGTRPNCRHFFVVVDLLSALTMPEEILVPDVRVRARKKDPNKIYDEIKKVLLM